MTSSLAVLEAMHLHQVHPTLSPAATGLRSNLPAPGIRLHSHFPAPSHMAIPPSLQGSGLARAGMHSPASPACTEARVLLRSHTAKLSVRLQGRSLGRATRLAQPCQPSLDRGHLEASIPPHQPHGGVHGLQHLLLPPLVPLLAGRHQRAAGAWAPAACAVQPQPAQNR